MCLQKNVSRLKNTRIVMTSATIRFLSELRTDFYELHSTQDKRTETMKASIQNRCKGAAWTVAAGAFFVGTCGTAVIGCGIAVTTFCTIASVAAAIFAHDSIVRGKNIKATLSAEDLTMVPASRGTILGSIRHSMYKLCRFQREHIV